MSTTVYSYYDSSGLRNYIDDPELLKLGPWSFSGTYFAPPPYSAVTAGNSLYLCITTNTGQNPAIVTVPPRYWSPLVIVSEGTTPNEADAAFILAGSAYALAGTAFTLAGSALNVANTAITIANGAFSVATSGTNLALLAYTIAQEGTNTGTAALTLAQTALTAAQNALPLTGGTISGSITVVGWGTVEGNLLARNVQVSVGTVPATASGTIFYDFAGPAYQITTVDRPLNISATEFYPGREIAVILAATGSNYGLTFPSSFTWYGTTPPSSIAGKNVLIAMTSITSSINGVIAASSFAQ